MVLGILESVVGDERRTPGADSPERRLDAAIPGLRAKGEVRASALGRCLLSQVSNGPTDGMNNEPRLFTGRACGFHSAHALIAMVFLSCGGITRSPTFPSATESSCATRESAARRGEG